MPSPTPARPAGRPRTGRPPAAAAGPRVADQLNPSDPVDRQIIARQVKAARQAGREGRDRAKVTRGRPDLEAAYDEGAAAGAGTSGDEGTGEPEQPQADQPASRTKRAAQGVVRSASWSSGQLSRGSWRPTTPLTRTRPRQAGGLLAGALLYVAVITYVRYGVDGWKGWLAAKFFNEPMSAADAKAAANGTKTTTAKGAAT